MDATSGCVIMVAVTIMFMASVTGNTCMTDGSLRLRAGVKLVMVKVIVMVMVKVMVMVSVTVSISITLQGIATELAVLMDRITAGAALCIHRE